MVHRLAAALAAVLLMAAAPSPVAACCGNVFHKTPIGWTTEGALLVETYDSSECESNATAEVHTPGDFTPDSRFDLYDDGRQLRGLEQGVRINPWEADPDIAEPGDIPTSLAHRFAESVPSLCARDIYVQASPVRGEPADISPWDSKLQVTVSVLTDDGFTEVTGGHP